MKTLFTLFSVLILTAFTQCSKHPECIDLEKRKANRDRVCIMLYEPVCGCNGKTYGNACLANNDGVISYLPGECDTFNIRKEK